MNRKFLSFLLALVLVICMAVPALAISGNFGGIGYTYTASTTVSRATSSMTCELHTVNLRTTITTQVYLLAENATVTGQTGSGTGKSSASASIGNYAWSPTYQAYTAGEITSARAQYYPW